MAELPSSSPSPCLPASPSPSLVLASASPRRAELLERLGAVFRIRPADLDETPAEAESPTDLVRRLSAAKAMAVAHDSHPDEIVLAADTEVVLDGGSLGKPRDAAAAQAMLRSLSGRVHEVVTGVAVRRGPTRCGHLVSTLVTFRDLTDDEIAWYVATGEPQGKAGGYALQGAGAALIGRIEGSHSNVIGLPLTETVELLRGVGLDLLAPPTQAAR